MRSASLLVLSPVAILVLAGCPDMVRAPPPPGLEGGIGDGAIIPPPPRRDGGPGTDGGPARTDGGGEDASVDGGRPPGCIPVEGPTDPNRAAITLEDGSEFPFAVRSAFATWRCFVAAEPVLLVGLTDGTCTPTSGEQLVFALDKTLMVAPYEVVPETGSSDLITARFYAPRAGSPGSDEWGTCAGATGTLELAEFGLVPGTVLTGSYDLTLTDCQGTSLPPVRVMGSFAVPLDFGEDAICG